MGKRGFRILVDTHKLVEKGRKEEI